MSARREEETVVTNKTLSLEEPWENGKFVMTTLRASKKISAEVGKRFKMRDRSIGGVDIEDAGQTGLVYALKYGKKKPQYIVRNLWWGSMQALSKACQYGREGHKLLMYDQDSHSGKETRAIIHSLKSKEKRTDYLLECRETVSVLMSKCHFEPWTIELLVRSIVHGTPYTALAREIGVSPQALGERLKRMTDTLHKVAKERNIPNPMDDYYKIEKGLK